VAFSFGLSQHDSLSMMLKGQLEGHPITFAKSYLLEVSYNFYPPFKGVDYTKA